jgi:hypothetical protein
MFCREQRTPKVSKRRSRRADRMKALRAMRAEIVSRRRLIGHQQKATASAWACVIILLER